MPIVYNGTSINEIKFNSIQIDKVNYNGVTVWEKFPEGYRRLNYLESNGTQEINLNYSPKIDFKIELDAQILSNKDGDGLFGYFLRGSGIDYKVLIATNGKSNSVTMAAGSTQIEVENTTSQRHKYGLALGKCFIDDVLKGTTDNKFSTRNTSLFTVNTNVSGVWNGKIAARVYGLKIYENDVLIKNLVPAYHINYELAGLLDIIDLKFYRQSRGDYFIYS